MYHSECICVLITHTHTHLLCLHICWELVDLLHWLAQECLVAWHGVLGYNVGKLFTCLT
jgi:hypothetical protein